MPTMNYYFLNHPEALNHEITAGDIVVMAITVVVIVAIAGIIVHVCERYL